MKNELYGYLRPDGRYGVRNHVLVVSTSDLSNSTARKICQLIKGAIPICPGFGRCAIGADLEQHFRTLAGLITNPNIYGAVIVSMEPMSAGKLADMVRAYGQPIECFDYDTCGGPLHVVEQASRAAMSMIADASEQQRVPMPLSSLILGVECGGSDTTSGVINNPAIGHVADAVVEAGGTVILSETVEWMGAEELLAARCADKEIADAIRQSVQFYEDYVRRIGQDLRGSNPTPDNIKGGLSTIEEKALGSVKKGGTSQIRELVQYAQKPSCRGLVLMDAPAAGVENMTGLAAGGCQLILFSTGKGNPIGNPIVPTVKITGNPRTIVNAPETIDVDLSKVITEDISLEQAGKLLAEQTIRFANGRRCAAEILETVDISVSRIGYTV